MDVEKIKNKIITISGEPVTGKGTTVAAVVEKLKKRGYREKNIHVITTGHEFRNYFNAIVEECISNPDFISNLNNIKELKRISKSKEILSILSDSHYSKEFIKEVEKFKDEMKNANTRTELIKRLTNQRKVSKKKTSTPLITIEEANNMPELDGIRKLVDTVIDENTKKLGKEINQKNRPNEVWIIDSRLAFHEIPDSFSVRLTCRPDIAGERLFNDKKRGKEDSGYKNVEAAIVEREKRKNGEIKRYIERYGIDLTSEDNYKLVIDTSFSTIDDISNTILTCLDRYSKGEEFTRNWISPIALVGTQFMGDTCDPSFAGMRKANGENLGIGDLYSWIDFFKNNSFNPSPEYALNVNEIEGIKYLGNGDGHHRNFGMLLARKTLIPYHIVKGKPEIQVKGIYNGVLDHEEIINYYHEKLYGKELNFKYSSIYPNIEKVSLRLDGKIKENKER